MVPWLLVLLVNVLYEFQIEDVQPTNTLQTQFLLTTIEDANNFSKFKIVLIYHCGRME